MIDEKFSAHSFAALGIDSKEARQLSDLLQLEVTKAMQEVIEVRFDQIISTLNSMGHDLRLYEEKQPGDISFRDDFEDVGYHCKLRLAFDYIVSAGYSDTINLEDLDENLR